jgi:ubiquinone/menaquinone biosynthesis C-methylase UbiE
VTKLSFDSGASAWDRFSARLSVLYLPTLLDAADIRDGQRVLDVATGGARSAVEAAALVGKSGLVVATDLSFPMLQRAKRNLGHFPVRLVAMDGQALSCPAAAFDAVICHLGLMFFPNVAAGLAEFRRVLRPAGRVAVTMTTSPARTVYGRVFEAARRYLPSTTDAMAWDFTLGDPQRLETLLLGASFRNVRVTQEIREVPFDSLEDYWGPMEAGGGLSGATYLALSPEDRQTVREEIRRTLLPSHSEGPFAVEMTVLLGVGQQ